MRRSDWGNMRTRRPILDAIAQFNQTALEPATWPAALDAAVDLLGGDHAVLIANNPPAMLPFGVFAGLDARDSERFVSPLAMRLAASFEQLLIPGVVVSSADRFSDPEFERTEFYNEILRPANGFYSASVSVRDDRENLAFHLSICRSRNRGPFTANETQQLEMLLPHMTVALDLRQRLDVSDHQARGFAEALHSLTDGVIVLDESNRLLVVNARAEKILQQGDGLAFASGRLRTPVAALTSKLFDAIALAGASATANQQIYLPRLPPRLPLLLTVIPIRQFRVQLPGLGMPRVLILIKEPDARSEIDREAIEDIFKLTPRESEIAALLADGASAREIAGRLALTVGTVRFNIKRIFQKTATHSQTALVVLVRQFSREHGHS
jgi:DNA-binding CsgD family transcriptional regulator/PAS domain-containing protein